MSCIVMDRSMMHKKSVSTEVQPVFKRQRYPDVLMNERGDVYFEFLICMVLFIMLLSATLQVISAIQLKFWLDRKTAAIVRHVQIRGEIDHAADGMISEIEERLGESVVVEWEAQFITGTRKVQLGDQVRLRVYGEKTLFSFGKAEVVKIRLESEMVGTCERYWKT